ncbi:hypothetical protein JOB18_046984 [Solea senegalensis]|uniref:Uncharacterized protein n=1 Tax=Solea senegalensis TaxID=28829 RepID=A0AAV6QGM5_SOLSE|nr:hypothetical protein JOB18_046984 [Solea senegalensis]
MSFEPHSSPVGGGIAAYSWMSTTNKPNTRNESSEQNQEVKLRFVIFSIVREKYPSRIISPVIPAFFVCGSLKTYSTVRAGRKEKLPGLTDTASPCLCSEHQVHVVGGKQGKGGGKE